MKKWKKIVLIIAALTVVLLTAAAGIMSYFIGKSVAFGIVYQNEGVDTEENSIKHLEKAGFSLESFENTYKPEAVSFEAEDSNKVYAQYIKADGNADNNTAILLHGLGGDNKSMYPVAEIYLKNGWNVISVDQRASGKSESEFISFGYFERLDVRAAVRFAKQYTDKKIAVHGQSMGAATAGLYAADCSDDVKADYIIMDSPYDSMKSMFLGVWHEMPESEGTPDGYVIACGDWYLKHKFGFTFDDADIVKKSADILIPTLIIQGTKDEMTVESMGDEVYKSIGSEIKEIWKVDSDHIMSVLDFPEEYEETIMKFLK